MNVFLAVALTSQDRQRKRARLLSVICTKSGHNVSSFNVSFIERHVGKAEKRSGDKGDHQTMSVTAETVKVSYLVMEI